MTKVITKANHGKETIMENQWELKEKKKQTAWSAGKNEDQVAIGFSFESDWLRKWHEVSWPIT